MSKPLVNQQAIEDFCRKWHVCEFSLFGSILGDDFHPGSDIDVLVDFEPGYGITFENRVNMLDELEAVFGRPIDLVNKRLLRNPYRRHAILCRRKVLYAA